MVNKGNHVNGRELAISALNLSKPFHSQRLEGH